MNKVIHGTKNRFENFYFFMGHIKLQNCAKGAYQVCTLCVFHVYQPWIFNGANVHRKTLKTNGHLSTAIALQTPHGRLEEHTSFRWLSLG